MHFGTFDLSDEPIGEPKHILKELMVEEKMQEEILFSTIGLAEEFTAISQLK
jgi:hypothetical protein